MSRYCADFDSAPILEAAKHWRDTAMIRDGSVFSSASLWTSLGFEALERFFVKNLDEGEGNFWQKLQAQLTPTSAAVKQLAAEMTWVMLLCPCNVGPVDKREKVRQVWQWSGEQFPSDAERWLTDTVLTGVGSAGPGFNNHRWRELVFFIETGLAFKRLDFTNREQLLADPWRFAEWLQGIPDAEPRQLRHMLVFLLFPDDFERIFGGGHRRAVAQAFSGLSRQVINSKNALELDRTLRKIRSDLEHKYGTQELDYYRPPLNELWNPSFKGATHEITAEHVKQAIIDIDQNGIPAGAESTFYDLLYEGKRYPPKLVLSLAAKSATGSEYDRTQFSGGQSSPAFRLLRNLGFIIVAKEQPQAATPDTHASTYSVDEALDDLFIARNTFTSILKRMREKKNVILQGPPGIGKTFYARRLAYALMGEKADDRISFIQFHPSYAYEDFVQGYRPNGTGFTLKDGVFFNFCRVAQADPEHTYVFVIDEINRGNLAKVFGELLMLIEADKRAPSWALQLAYASDDDPPFYVSANVHILGLMNTADRSLAMVDYALRRRFAFVDLAPGFGTVQFRKYMQGVGISDDLIARMDEDFCLLNEEISRDHANLGPGFCIGHSYFCGASEVHDVEWYRAVIQCEIIPLLREYWFDDVSKVESWTKRLLRD